MNAFNAAINAALTTRRSTAGVTATYARDDQEVELTVVPGSTEVEVGDAVLANVASRISDFMFAAAALVLGGATVTPQRGDTITVELDGVTSVYVVSPFRSEPAWRYVDPAHTEIRVHTLLESRS